MPARPTRNRRYGALDREIFALALPTFATLVTEPLLLIADSAFIGHLGTDQLAGLGHRRQPDRHRRRAVHLPGVRDHEHGRPSARRR